MTSEAHATEAPDSSAWAVGRCTCGRVVLSLGDVQRSFTADEFAELHQLLQAAMRQFGIPLNSPVLPVSRGVMH